ncbi:hypothetical protein, partial [Curvivirga aplysinae]|uniref:hypothetical protein n=1 Tax=Curvivirga aplysinae TaxID=2529852 RepID=UPI001C3F7BB8
MNKNRDEILRDKEIRAKAELAELAEQGSGFGTGFAKGALKKQQVLKEEEVKLYEGATGNKKSTNCIFLGLLAIFALILIFNLLSRFL